MPRPRSVTCDGALCVSGAGDELILTRADGLITVADAAALAGVDQRTVRNWIYRGYHSDVLGTRCFLRVAKREGWLILLDPVEVAKAEHATAKRARRPSAALA